MCDTGAGCSDCERVRGAALLALSRTVSARNPHLSPTSQRPVRHRSGAPTTLASVARPEWIVTNCSSFLQNSPCSRARITFTSDSQTPPLARGCCCAEFAGRFMSADRHRLDGEVSSPKHRHPPGDCKRTSWNDDDGMTLKSRKRRTCRYAPSPFVTHRFAFFLFFLLSYRHHHDQVPSFVGVAGMTMDPP